MNHVTALAVDLGSSSGQIVAGTLIDGRIDEVEVQRFPHQARFVDGYLTWDWTSSGARSWRACVRPSPASRTR